MCLLTYTIPQLSEIPQFKKRVEVRVICYLCANALSVCVLQTNDPPRNEPEHHLLVTNRKKKTTSLARVVSGFAFSASERSSSSLPSALILPHSHRQSRRQRLSM